MFLIFGGQDYYARGGACDLIETHDDKSCAIQIAVDLIGMKAITRKAREEDLDWDEDDTKNIEWTQVYDTDSGDIVYASKDCHSELIKGVSHEG